MPMFGKLRRARQAADIQKDKKAESAGEPTPYRHVPTHAATDALLGAPATWREQDKKAIQAHHERRRQHNLSRNQSSLSNVTTLTIDRSLTSTEWAYSATNRRKHYSTDWAGTRNVPRNSQLTLSGSSSSTNFSRSQLRSIDRSSKHTDPRGSRFDRAEPAPQIASTIEYSSDPPYEGIAGPSKDAKFYRASSGDVSPDYCSEDSHPSSWDLSLHDPVLAVPPRHPRRSLAQNSLPRPYDHQSNFQKSSQNFKRKIGEFPRPPAAADQQQADMLPLPSTTRKRGEENDFSFIDFDRASSEVGYSVTAH